ncbi:MAG: translation initiation factor eIF-1A [Candidatus Thermoplasmatota archaeon]|nr:translation initiation factor eIF-1A [Euryarchaeota archaeon]MBU4031192.1 translation initiation factor eIF-1A [Candidatus Thermoplasmatota archaeon]MBU4071196.1 translation initiation factor eIF-1A [Candidatus Thermoplasmatota archaeon]MBU4143476.1 translation initiation factor eIF-1A [Candidatus Thermoplasmatota archaeon]MBU4592749.1 translation initiation factor eIF-1A [Candidatus Thermoplasmatota archaeon]
MVPDGDKPGGGPEEVYRSPLPKEYKREMFAIADQLLGASKIRVMCADGKSRIGRIPGKLKKRMWIREGDLLIIRPWEFQEDKADILFRYTRTQATSLARRRMIPEVINIY